MKHNNPDKKQYIFGGQLFPSAKGAEILVEIFGVGEIKIRTWLCRIGMWAKKLHERFILESEDCDHTFNVYIL